MKKQSNTRFSFNNMQPVAADEQQKVEGGLLAELAAVAIMGGIVYGGWKAYPHAVAAAKKWRDRGK